MQLYDKLSKLDITLDELVHSAYQAMASNVNNEGLQGQLSALSQSGWTESDILEYLTTHKMIGHCQKCRIVIPDDSKKYCHMCRTDWGSTNH